MDRRNFIINSSLATAALILEPGPDYAATDLPGNPVSNFPLVISTWDFGYKANEVS